MDEAINSRRVVEELISITCATAYDDPDLTST